MIFRGKQSGIFHNFTTDVDLGYRYIQKLEGGISWYKLENKVFTSIVSFKLKDEKNQIVSSNGQSLTFRLSITKNLFISDKCQKH